MVHRSQCLQLHIVAIFIILTFALLRDSGTNADNTKIARVNLFKYLLSGNLISNGNLKKLFSSSLPSKPFLSRPVRRLGSEFLGKRSIWENDFDGERSPSLDFEEDTDIGNKNNLTEIKNKKKIDYGNRNIKGLFSFLKNRDDFYGKRFGSYHNTRAFLPEYRRDRVGSEFLGKRSINYDDLGKRALGSEFLGKRALGSEFLGKRALGSEFLGKRALGSEFLGKRAIGSEFLGKRALGSEFLGKRALGSEFLGKRALGSEFLGKRALGSEFLGKRALGSEFLGKRYSGNEFLGRTSPGNDFLNKVDLGNRYMDKLLCDKPFDENCDLNNIKNSYIDEEHKIESLGEALRSKSENVIWDKRALGREFLGKKNNEMEPYNKDGMGNEFVGKQPEESVLYNEFENNLLGKLEKRAIGSEFLGKRAIGREFLGKRPSGLIVKEYLGEKEHEGNDSSGVLNEMRHTNDIYRDLNSLTDSDPDTLRLSDHNFLQKSHDVIPHFQPHTIQNTQELTNLDFDSISRKDVDNWRNSKSLSNEHEN